MIMAWMAGLSAACGARRLTRLLAVSAVVSALTLLAAVPGASAARYVGTGTHPWLIVLCKFNDKTGEPHTPAYYSDMFANGGKGGLFDYWHDVSFGQLNLTGTVVKGWYQLNMNRYTWSGLSRQHKFETCAAAAKNDVNYSDFWGVAVISNNDAYAYTPASTTLTSNIDNSTTTMNVASSSGFPAPPFAVFVNNAAGSSPEEMNVTNVSGNTWTVQRGFEDTRFPATSHASGDTVSWITGGDLFGYVGQKNFNFGGTAATVAGVVFPEQVSDTLAGHEMGHGHGYDHSRTMSSSTTDYNDCYDIMSALSCVATFNGPFGGDSLGTGGGLDAGSGLDAINLDAQGWIPGSRLLSFDNSTSNQSTVTLHSLGDPTALSAPGSENLEARVPASVTIQNSAPNGAGPSNPPVCSGTNYSCTTSQYYTVEYREKSGWDQGIPASSVLLHLRGGDNYSYWVNQTPNAHGGALYAGDEYVDSANKAYFAVNSIDAGAHSAQVTLASRKIDADLTISGATSGDFNDRVTLAADLKVRGSGASVPQQPIALTVGSQSCPAVTDSSGHASCQITLTDHPGSNTVSANFSGDTAYNSANGSAPFTINQEESQPTYTGATTSDYHDAFTASATLVDPDGGAPIAGKNVTFTLGAGDTCSATTDGSGSASCQITPTQPAGNYNIVASFGPDTDYLSSTDTKQFTITREQTTTTYTGPTVILQGGSGVTLQGRLLEDGISPIQGRTLTLSIGSQSCTGTTDASGYASCVVVVSGPLGSQPLVASFAGDAYYLPSSDLSKTAVVFAFPSRGAFTLGDTTAGTAGALTVTWWSHGWASQNTLSGGVASNSFKGFAATVPLPTSTPPAACAGPWTTGPGNRSNPPDSVPSYMGVLVTSSVSKSGSSVSGNTVHIVVVKTDSGYASNPGHPGTGTIIATYC